MKTLSLSKELQLYLKAILLIWIGLTFIQLGIITLRNSKTLQVLEKQVEQTNAELLKRSLTSCSDNQLPEIRDGEIICRDFERGE